jgi:hypothetical protein
MLWFNIGLKGTLNQMMAGVEIKAGILFHLDRAPLQQKLEKTMPLLT